MTIRFHIKFRNKDFQLVVDKLLLFKFMKDLNGRFWGIFGVMGFNSGLLISFLIRPDLRTWSTTFSLFGTDLRTAPYFLAALFIAAYGLWRWRDYLSKTTYKPGITTSLITVTIIGLYIVAFMPLNWTPRVTSIHYFGFGLVGLSAAATVIADILLHKTRPRRDKLRWQVIRLTTVSFILIGITITTLSSSIFNNYIEQGLIGEFLIMLGYTIWIFVKTYQGECETSNFADKMREIFIFE